MQEASCYPQCQAKSRYTATGSTQTSRCSRLSSPIRHDAPCNSILLRMDDFARVSQDSPVDAALAKRSSDGGFTHRGDRVVPMSEALKDGDQVVVTAGHAAGPRGASLKLLIDARALLFGAQPVGRRVTTRVGLAVLSNEAARHAESQKADCLAASGLHRTGRISDPDENIGKRTCRTSICNRCATGAALIARAMDRRAMRPHNAMHALHRLALATGP